MRFVHLLRLVLIPAGAVLSLLTAAPARGQFHTVPRERLDSMAHPPLARGAEALHFDRLRIETGRIDEDGGPKSYRFRWRNAGAEPLVVTRVTTTCGCAVPEYDRRPVKPGESAEITVIYHPKGHPGSFVRKIFLFTQLASNAPSAILELVGEVSPSARPTYAYPHARGNLLLKQEEIRLSGSVPRTESIECLNGGNDTLRIRINRQILPPCVRAGFSPEVLPPGGIGELTVRFDPAAGRIPPRIPVILEGLGLPPGQSAVTIRFDSGRPDTTNETNN